MTNLKVSTPYLTYDEADDRCTLNIQQSQGKLYAFITCVDDKNTGIHHYWGEYSHGNSEADIKRILESGGKWDGWTIPY